MKHFKELPLDRKINGMPNQVSGWYMIKIKGSRDKHFFCVVSDGEGWEHVSVSIRRIKKGQMQQVDRVPTWEEMCTVKDIFWNEDEAVVQYHPRKQDYVNLHPHVLHMWRPTEQELPLPNPVFVGPTGLKIRPKHLKAR